jgi:hypothetical protein
MKTRIYLYLILILACAICGAGCQKTDSETTAPAAAANAPAVTAEQTPAPSQSPPETVTPTPIKDALTTLFAKEAEDAKSPFPKGTHLLSIDLKDKTASVDVSKEFNELANKGESMEGLAQKKLCATLAEFPTVDTLRLTVEGKDFESQAADWRSIPVRVAKDASEAGGSRQKSNGMQQAGSLDR